MEFCREYESSVENVFRSVEHMRALSRMRGAL